MTSVSKGLHNRFWIRAQISEFGQLGLVRTEMCSRAETVITHRQVTGKRVGNFNQVRSGENGSSERVRSDDVVSRLTGMLIGVSDE